MPYYQWVERAGEMHLHVDVELVREKERDQEDQDDQEPDTEVLLPPFFIRPFHIP